tara:strand:+ start:52 stop:825 length:774 start_codon:yes stop_codon:yes gene_type:complete
MSVDYEQLKILVKEAMYTGGGFADGSAPTSGGAIMGPSAPEGIPHRMPAADTADKAQDKGSAKANELYDVALVAREATEVLVEALDDPTFDAAYEHAFKASANLRRVLNSLEETGASPMPQQRVVAPPPSMQKYAGGSNAGGYAGGLGTNAMGAGELEEAEDALKGFGSGVTTQSSHAAAEKGKSMAVAKGDVLGGVDDRERKILLQIEDVLTDIAEKADLVKYRPLLKTFLSQFLNKVKKDPGSSNTVQSTTPEGK